MVTRNAKKKNNKCIKKWFKAFIMQFLCLQPFDASIGSKI